MEENRNFESQIMEKQTEEENKSIEVREPVSARDAWHAKVRGERSQREVQRPQPEQQAVYSSSGYSGGSYSYHVGSATAAVSTKGRKKPLLIFGGIVVGILLLAILFAVFDIGEDEEDLSGAADVNEKHIGVLFVEGTISESDTVYNHWYALDAIDGMMENDDNKGLMLYINTPGGGVYESDELYLKIKEYQDETGRPVYAYLGNQATSGGYYIAAPADRIAANRNCWTGSIGVTIGNLYDISGLLEKYGIDVNTITSGENKAMGDITQPLTKEQQEILQSMVDEAYDQFVDIVAEGRNLDAAYVRKIADGRIYTAKQAEQLQLVDGIVNTYDDAVAEMMTAFELEDCETYEFQYVPEYDLLGSFIESMDGLSEASSEKGDIAALIELLENENEIPLQYLCEVRK